MGLPRGAHLKVIARLENCNLLYSAWGRSKKRTSLKRFGPVRRKMCARRGVSIPKENYQMRLNIWRSILSLEQLKVLHTLANLISPTPSRLLWTRSKFVHKYPPLSITMYSFIRLSEPPQPRANEPAQDSSPQPNIRTRVLWIENLILQPQRYSAPDYS